MIMLKTLLAIIAVVLLPLNAHANIIYNWVGDCDGIITPVRGGGVNGCSGQATLHVVTTDSYIPGEVFRPNFLVPAVLLEALYSDSNATYDLAPNFNRNNGFAFLLPASLPNSEGDFGGGGGFLAEQSIFRSDANGIWRFSSEGVFRPPQCIDAESPDHCGHDARGFNGVWTRVPAPSTLVLLGVGLAGLVFHRRRRTSSAHRVNP